MPLNKCPKCGKSNGWRGFKLTNRFDSIGKAWYQYAPRIHLCRNCGAHLVLHPKALKLHIAFIAMIAIYILTKSWIFSALDLTAITQKIMIDILFLLLVITPYYIAMNKFGYVVVAKKKKPKILR